MKILKLWDLQFQKKSKRKAWEKQKSGLFKFFTSSKIQKYFINEADFTWPALIFWTWWSASVHFCGEDFSTSTDCFILKSNNDEIYLKYIYYYLFGNIDILERGFHWAWLKHVSKLYLSELEIPLPSLQIQKAIVNKLDKLSNLIELRKESIKKTEDLTKSIFIEMFGDPMVNEKGWEIKELWQFWEIKTWNTPSRKEKENYWNYIEWIKSDNINNSSLIASKSSEFLSEKWLQRWRIVPKWSILVTCIAWSLSCIGNCSIVDRSVSFNQQINSITPNDHTNSFFIYYLFLIAKEVIQKASTNWMKWMISKWIFQKLNFILPPITLQNKFAEIVQRNEENIKKQKESLVKLEELYSSEMQESFSF
jgi:type I restriction enzyme S subunit